MRKYLGLIGAITLAGYWPWLSATAAEATSVTTTTAAGYFFAGAQSAGNKMGYSANSVNGTGLLLGTVATIINFVSSLLGVIFLVVAIYAGILWMMAAGNEKQVTKSKEILKAASIGLIVILSAYAITFFIIKRLT